MKPRHNIYLDDETSAGLEALAAQPGASKSAIIGDALRHDIRHRGSAELDEALKIRLDRLSRENALVRRDIEVLTESLAFFVRLYLTFNAHTPVPDQATQAVWPILPSSRCETQDGMNRWGIPGVGGGRWNSAGENRRK